tara:strand:- start:259 stop:519 length:261 start_codon:yes stop_codon:yes gene_type:complete
MLNEHGKEMTEKEKIKEALACLSEACFLLFETESVEGRQFAFVVDSALKLGQVIYNEDDPLDAASDYTAYEEYILNKNVVKLKEVK